ncbi:ribulokinase [Ruficoccus sp. ZRK36]|uniref:ribulokinase n=1 Tax=Ruficoccus sp. ZRK36 TaxID=2866311 RepID=UPI001C72D2ED|nr:ribulokinase [Ruficoccus sp. ZRK36]QYY34492.1 ribulokinase [Ruficoccus sp. ZRK36]
MPYTLGLDYGTNSARAILVRCRDGKVVGSCVQDYPSGTQGVLLSERDHLVARQHPGDYLSTLETMVLGAMAQAMEDSEFSPDKVIGIGVDSTGSSPLPVMADNSALGCHPDYRDNLNAQCWLWKDHTSHAEATKITDLCWEHRPEYLAKCGGTYSSEWWWSKIWHCLNADPDTFEACYSWVELCDWVPSQLAGVTRPEDIKRGVCSAGHKAFYAEDWGGLPDREFLDMLDPRIGALRDRLYDRAYDASHAAGSLCEAWALRLGLLAGIPIAIGEMDVHYGAIGCGVDEGALVKVIGTSTCDCTVVRADKEVADIPGICGIVKGSILPGYYGIEAGQSAVGDLFKWWVEGVCQGKPELHCELTKEMAGLKPGQSGLLSLDWNNGNRTVLVDQRLSGLILGQTLHTTRAEIYRALIEATAFGARMILERIAEYGVPVKRIICAGGIAEKNAVLMQIYADVTGRKIQVSRSDQSCALGSAIAAAVIAGPQAGGYEDFASAQAAMTGVKDIVYEPNPQAHVVYDKLFALYRQLHDAFGGVKTEALGHVMKDLMLIKEQSLQVASNKKALKNNHTDEEPLYPRTVVRDREPASIRL